MTQFLIEEAISERLDHVDREMKRRLGNLGIESTDLGGGGGFSSLSPGEIQQAEHAARMAQRTGGGV